MVKKFKWFIDFPVYTRVLPFSLALLGWALLEGTSRAVLGINYSLEAKVGPTFGHVIVYGSLVSGVIFLVNIYIVNVEYVKSLGKLSHSCK